MGSPRDMSAVPSGDLPFYDEQDEVWRVALSRWDGRGFGGDGSDLYNYLTVAATADGDVYIEDGAGGNDTILTVVEAQLLVEALAAAIEKAEQTPPRTQLRR